MGKCGARELNYISDVDVIYVIECRRRWTTPGPARIGTRPGHRHLPGDLCPRAASPGLWEVDANLRPEGKYGPLVRTLASHLSYYAALGRELGVPGPAEGPRPSPGTRSWAPLRGSRGAADLVLRRSARALSNPSRSMRRRVTEHIPADEEQPPDQAGPRRPARRRVHRPAAAAGARQVRRIPALPGHHLGHRGALRRRLHRPLRRRGLRPRLPLPAAPGAPDPAVPAAPDAPDAGRAKRRCAPWPRRCWARSPTERPAAGRAAGRSGRRPSGPCGSCTNAFSTGRC